MHLWVRAEQRPNERRVGITPDGVRALVAAGLSVTVEESTDRIIPIQGYADAGAVIASQNSWPDAPREAVVFGLKELPETSPITDVVVWIGTSQGTFTFTAPGKISVVHNFAFYWPSADSDGDGLPDANAEPAYEVQILSEDTRLMPPE